LTGLTRLVLASASPRRQALLGLLGLSWRAVPPTIDEARYLLADLVASALNVALAKSRATPVEAAEMVVAADTIVASDGLPLGKPSSASAAFAMLAALRGRAHEVLTGVVLRAADGREWGAVVSTRVVMRAYTEAEIDAYVARGEPFDKAGGYAVQDAAFQPVARCEGCYLNVVGVPLCAVVAGLNALGVEVPGPLGPAIAAPRADMRPPCVYCTAGAPLVAI
jgi:nucleoside triphosphate pyrophosphatase